MPGTRTGCVAPALRIASINCCMPAARQPSSGMTLTFLQQPHTSTAGRSASGCGSLNSSNTIEWSPLNVAANDRQNAGALAASGITWSASSQGENSLPGGLYVVELSEGQWYGQGLSPST